MELIIAKEKFTDTNLITNKIWYDDWKKYIDQNKNYYSWLEETSKGKNILNNIKKVPDWAREGVIKQLNKGQALAEYNIKGWHDMVIDFNIDNGFVRITLMKRLNKKILSKLHDMANALDAILIKDRKKVI